MQVVAPGREMRVPSQEIGLVPFPRQTELRGHGSQDVAPTALVHEPAGHLEHSTEHVPSSLQQAAPRATGTSVIKTLKIETPVDAPMPHRDDAKSASRAVVLTDSLTHGNDANRISSCSMHETSAAKSATRDMVKECRRGISLAVKALPSRWSRRRWHAGRRAAGASRAAAGSATRLPDSVPECQCHHECPPPRARVVTKSEHS